jgi:hypothetical protein
LGERDPAGEHNRAYAALRGQPFAGMVPVGCERGANISRTMHVHAWERLFITSLVGRVCVND